MRDDVDVLLFDLGGVLLELNDPAATFGIDGDVDTYHRRWLTSPAVLEFERVAIDPQQFAARVIREAGLPYPADAFLERFNAWPGALFDGALPLLDELGRHFRLALLSNTNTSHWHADGVSDRLEPRFEHLFLSYETGLLKPDEDAFAHVVSTLGAAPDTILFFDDSALNVESARRCGLQAERVLGPADVRHILNVACG